MESLALNWTRREYRVKLILFCVELYVLNNSINTINLIMFVAVTQRPPWHPLRPVWMSPSESTVSLTAYKTPLSNSPSAAANLKLELI